MLSDLRSVNRDQCDENVSFTAQERRDLDKDANLYSLIRTCEHLERGFVNGSIPQDVYERHCQQLLAQFNTIRTALRSQQLDVSEFIRQHNMDCPLAVERLLGTGIAATKLHQMGSVADLSNESLYVFETSQHLTTVMDTLKLNMRSIDELVPPFKEMLSSFSKIGSLPADLDGLEKCKEWLYTLNAMSAADELNDAQARQFSMDLENCYNAFHKWLREK